MQTLWQKLVNKNNSQMKGLHILPHELHFTQTWLKIMTNSFSTYITLWG
jgi:hypothetical protein